jgi:hypothetical protein
MKRAILTGPPADSGSNNSLVLNHLMVKRIAAKVKRIAPWRLCMHELAKLIAAERLQKAAEAQLAEVAGLMKRLDALTDQLANIEEWDRYWRSFIEATTLASVAAHVFPAPKAL